MLLGNFIGKGNTAEVYELKDQNNKVVKLFFERMPFEYIEHEYETSKIINQLGVPSPKVGELLKLDQTWCIVYEKITGRGFTQLLSSQPFSLKRNALIFAELQASFHQRTTNQLTPQKEYLSRNISGTNLLSTEEKNEILNYLKKLPGDNKVCHGDYHPDNIILIEDQPKILDWMTGTSGNPIADVARTLIILKYSSLPKGMPKSTKMLIQIVRKMFTRFYLNSYIKLTNASRENIDQWLLPVMASRLVEGIPESEKHFLLEEIKNKLKDNLYYS